MVELSGRVLVRLHERANGLGSKRIEIESCSSILQVPFELDVEDNGYVFQGKVDKAVVELELLDRKREGRGLEESHQKLSREGSVSENVWRGTGLPRCGNT